MNTTTIVAQIAEWLGVIAVAWLLSLSPRFSRGQVGFRYARRDGMAALSIIFIAIIFSFIFYNSGLGDTLSGFFRLPGAAAELARPLALALFSLLPVIAALLLRGQPLRSAGWNGTMLRPGLQVGLALVLLTIFLRNRVMDVLGGISTDETWYLIGALGIAVAEETIFRGYIQLRLNFWRLPGLMGGSSLPVILIGLGLVLAQGLVTGFLMRKCNHLLAPVLYRAVSIWMNVFV